MTVLFAAFFKTMSRKALAGQYMGRANPIYYDTQKAELRLALVFWRSGEEAEDVPVFLSTGSLSAELDKDDISRK